MVHIIRRLRGSETSNVALAESTYESTPTDSETEKKVREEVKGDEK